MIRLSPIVKYSSLLPLFFLCGWAVFQSHCGLSPGQEGYGSLAWFLRFLHERVICAPNYLIQTERQHTNALRYEELYQILGSYAPVRISFCIVRFSLLLREAH